MARFDVYRSTDGEYLLDVQADLLRNLSTRVVVPLMRNDVAPQPAHRLNPIFQINGDDFVMVTQFLASVPNSILTNHVANFSDRSSDIFNALDFLISGF